MFWSYFTAVYIRFSTNTFHLLNQIGTLTPDVLKNVSNKARHLKKYKRYSSIYHFKKYRRLRQIIKKDLQRAYNNYLPSNFGLLYKLNQNSW